MKGRNSMPSIFRDGDFHSPALLECSIEEVYWGDHSATLPHATARVASLLWTPPLTNPFTNSTAIHSCDSLARETPVKYNIPAEFQRCVLM
eukprot:960460-Amphidinium_carterae.2